MKNEILKVGEIWKHSKTGGEYEVVHLGRLQVKHEDLDMQECVVYKALSDGIIWVRPRADFLEVVEGVQRFVKVR